ncbi:hypothetical protein K2X33_03980 [bacterium]|nr:hypothetical protein [bacterium]
MENPNDFVFHTTADGSPTLSSGEGGEWMHHRAGAFSETQYVYGEALQLAWGTKGRSFVSVGLGLGYLEILLAAWAERFGGGESMSLRSFEAHPALRQSFLDWVTQTSSPAASLQAAYHRITERTAHKMDVAPSAISLRLRNWLRSGQWECEGALRDATEWPKRFDAILYDPFSSDTSPQLWSSGWLECFLDAAGEGRCVFASYAATSVLKKALLKKKFRLIAREGFAGKRECTLAVRP